VSSKICTILHIMYKDIGERLKKLRGDKSQKAFADMLGISLRSYICYEHGERPPTVEVLTRLAETTDANADWILGVKKPAEPTTFQVAEPPAEPYNDELKAFLKDTTIANIIKNLRVLCTEDHRSVLHSVEQMRLLKELLADREKKNKDE
jgi:transcriptional regulator with XRE-family HTH domain